ncbi:MAG TPA: acyl carrier protein [Treponema sp.]|nr:acyl carrier protein [Treponema sp.]
MTRQEINQKLNGVFQEVFDDDTITVADETTAKDIEDWDSLAHLTLVGSIEDAFGIKFTLGEINGFKNVGEMMDAMEKKLS